mmetsp:Transcript_14728/g.43196  ORF Transcript_14728/g.43196 Transcript_14728/m.43196 type:complete len:308 (+) Transcript_14728:136-1059(+)
MVVTRGQKDEKDLPPSVPISYDGKAAKYIAVAPGMSPDALAKAIKHVFKKELDGDFKDVEYDVMGVSYTNDDDKDELVPLETLARVPAIAIFKGNGEAMKLVLSKDKKKKETPPTFLQLVCQLIVYLVLIAVVRMTMLRPALRLLYRNGPAYHLGIFHLGFWEGARLASICASLTSSQDTSFWEANRRQCASIFTQKEEAFMVAVEVSLAVAAAVMYRSAIKGTMAGVHALIEGKVKEGIKLASAKLTGQVVKPATSHVHDRVMQPLQARAQAVAAEHRVGAVAAKVALACAALFLVLYGPLAPYLT